ncbi:uncharacterized protein LAESUDRAFT_765553 [Laetiporus sulphureus 93-53]|uniref:Uncharacterized protein n=1 Tax=Laetiporus sulphureus 93-53 TaxID=1314785 RepID=A0A165APL8_9APHY|nr:uncharacterized protein LAESUDRAFT_765553 [Laetiporus sulphureus 93-53]KZS99415.1 hypothetical protein LAESUDRAFT_765553 [Laetiporus sulphureus 93-53]
MPTQEIEVEDAEVEEDDDDDDEDDNDDKTYKLIITQMHLRKVGKGHLEAWCTAACFIPKIMRPFMDILMILQVSIACHGIAEELWDLDEWPDVDQEKASELMKQFCTLLKIIPGLSKLLPSLDNDPDSCHGTLDPVP